MVGCCLLRTCASSSMLPPRVAVGWGGVGPWRPAQGQGQAGCRPAAAGTRGLLIRGSRPRPVPCGWQTLAPRR